MSRYVSQPPPAYGFKTIPPQELVRFADSDDGHAGGPVPYIISMAPIDRVVLEALDVRWDLLNTLEKSDDHGVLLEHLFHNWDWTYTISSYIVNVLTDPIGSPQLQTRKERYLEALHLSGAIKGYAVEEFRSRIVQRDNGDFLQLLGDAPISSINFVRSQRDAKHWDILAAMYLRFPDEMLFWMNAPARRRFFNRHNEALEWFCAHFSIRIVSRIFDLRCRRPLNSKIMQELFGNSPSASSLRISMRYAVSEDQNLLSYVDIPGTSAPYRAPVSPDEPEGTSGGSESSRARSSIQVTVHEERGAPPRQERLDELRDERGPSVMENSIEHHRGPQGPQKEEEVHFEALQTALTVREISTVRQPRNMV
jgi:hypothetical protein